MKKTRTIKIYTDDILEVVSHFNDNIITSELNDYILHQCLGLSTKGVLTLQFVGELNEEEQDIIKKAIRSYYRFHIEHCRDIDKYDEWVCLALLILGIILIFVSQKFDYVINEFFLILGWLAIGELAYDVLFDKRLRTRDYLRYKQIYYSKIEFIKSEE